MSYKNFSNTYKDILTAEARKISPKERQLAMKGLGGENVQQIMRALQDPEKAVKNPQLRDIIMKVMQQLLDIVVDDPVTFMKTRKALTKEDKDVKESKVLNLENVVHIRKTTPKMEYVMIKSALKKHKGKYAESWDKHHVFEFKNPEIVDSFINELKSKYVEIPPNKEKK